MFRSAQVHRLLRASSGGIVLFCALHLVAPDYAATPARAQTTDEIAGARALGVQGHAAFQKGDYAATYELFRRAESLYHAPPHLLYMARASTRLGRLVEARELYNKIVRENLADSAPAAFKNAQAEAEEEMKELEPRIPFVTVELTGQAASDVRVMSQGKEIPAALIGVPRPMDPGKYEFTVESSEAEAAPVTVTVVEGESQTVTIELQALGKGPEHKSTTLKASSKNDSPGEQPKEEKGSLVPAITALSLGAIGAGLGTFFYFDRESRNEAATTSYENSQCQVDGNCSTKQQEDIKRVSRDAATSGTVSVISFSVGGAALVTGVVLLLTRGKKETKEAAALEMKRHVKPVFGVNSIGLSGRF